MSEVPIANSRRLCPLGARELTLLSGSSRAGWRRHDRRVQLAAVGQKRTNAPYSTIEAL